MGFRIKDLLKSELDFKYPEAIVLNYWQIKEGVVYRLLSSLWLFSKLQMQDVLGIFDFWVLFLKVKWKLVFWSTVLQVELWSYSHKIYKRLLHSTCQPGALCFHYSSHTAVSRVHNIFFLMLMSSIANGQAIYSFV